MIDRRSFLKLAASAAAGSAVFGLPFVRPAVAQPTRPPRARRVLLVNLYGGIRSSAAFHASSATKYNPYGVITGVPSPFAVGQLLDDYTVNPRIGETPLPDAAYRLSTAWQSARVSRLREVLHRFSVLGTFNPERGDHIQSQAQEPSGSGGGMAAGILTRIYSGLLATSASVVPPMQLNPSAAFGQAPGDLARFGPLRLQGPGNLPSEQQIDPAWVGATGNDFGLDATATRINDRMAASRRRDARILEDVYRSHYQGDRQLGADLAQPWLNIARPDFATASRGMVDVGGPANVPLTNAMLLELFVRALGPEPGDAMFAPRIDPATASMHSAATNAALAIRLLQYGSPAVALEYGSFDFHSRERTDGPELFHFTGRLWATLQWLLSRIPEPDGMGSMLDHTLVCTFSDFGRDGGAPANGYNGDEGCDHGAETSCYYLAHAIMGAGVLPGRLFGPLSGTPSPANYDAAATHATGFSHVNLLATVLDALGLDSASDAYGFDPMIPPIRSLWGT